MKDKTTFVLATISDSEWNLLGCGDMPDEMLIKHESSKEITRYIREDNVSEHDKTVFDDAYSRGFLAAWNTLAGSEEE